MPKRSATARKTRKGANLGPVLLPITDEMKQWSAMLGTELASWPQVRSKPMFGLVSYYRGANIFAALPRTRALNTPYSIIFKFHREDAATRRARKELQPYNGFPDAQWLAFELSGPQDFPQVLRWLDLAYRKAA